MWTSSPLGQNPYWLNVNKDIPNGAKIFEMWQKITFKFEGNLRLTDTRIRIDVFRAKTKAFTPNAGITPSLILPGALNHFAKDRNLGRFICATNVCKRMSSHPRKRLDRLSV